MSHLVCAWVAPKAKRAAVAKRIFVFMRFSSPRMPRILAYLLRKSGVALSELRCIFLPSQSNSGGDMNRAAAMPAFILCFWVASAAADPATETAALLARHRPITKAPGPGLQRLHQIGVGALFNGVDNVYYVDLFKLSITASL